MRVKSCSDYVLIERGENVSNKKGWLREEF